LRGKQGWGWFYSVAYGTEALIVNFSNKSCTYKSWEFSGIPCSHAIAVIREDRLNPCNFVHDYYLSEYLKITYSHTLRPMNGDDMWEKGMEK